MGVNIGGENNTGRENFENHQPNRANRDPVYFPV